MGIKTCRSLAATDGVDDFDLIAFAQRRGLVLAARHDIQVELDCYTTPGKIKAGQQCQNGRAVRQFKGFTVQLNVHAREQPSFLGASILARSGGMTKVKPCHSSLAT